MQPLHLHVVNKVRWQQHALLFAYNGRKPALILGLYFVEVGYSVVIYMLLQLAYPAKVVNEVVRPRLFGNQRRVFGIAQAKETPRGYAVGLVLEAFGIERVPVAEQIVFQYVRMYLGNAVHRA